MRCGERHPSGCGTCFAICSAIVLPAAAVAASMMLCNHRQRVACAARLRPFNDDGVVVRSSCAAERSAQLRSHATTIIIIIQQHHHHHPHHHRRLITIDNNVSNNRHCIHITHHHITSHQLSASAYCVKINTQTPNPSIRSIRLRLDGCHRWHRMHRMHISCDFPNATSLFCTTCRLREQKYIHLFYVRMQMIDADAMPQWVACLADGCASRSPSSMYHDA